MMRSSTTRWTQGQQPHADAGPNNLQLADLILSWIDQNVEVQESGAASLV